MIKKLIIIAGICIFSSAYAQTDTVAPAKTLMAGDLKELTGFAAYNATIIGYALSCQFDKKDTSLIYDNFFQEISVYPLTPEQKQQINDSFVKTLNTAQQEGVANSNTTCSDFKVDFEKIITHIQSQ